MDLFYLFRKKDKFFINDIKCNIFNNFCITLINSKTLI